MFENEESEQKPFESLTPVQIRVLGCLIEKEKTTPQYYPLTLNSLRLACNQSTNRDPVTDLGDDDIEFALNELRNRKLIRVVYSQTNRATKYKHVLTEIIPLTPEQEAILCVLLLRGPQTPGEIKSRTERMYPFTDLVQVQQILDRFHHENPNPHVIQLPRRPGQKDSRYMHTLGSMHHDLVRESSEGFASTEVSDISRPVVHSELVTQVLALSEKISLLESELEQLRDEFSKFKAQF